MVEKFAPQAVWNWPLSGAVSVPITMPGITVNLGTAGSGATEQDMLDSVGSYGRQIGWLTDALEVVIRRLDKIPLAKDEQLSQSDQDALETFKDYVATVRLRKALHKSKTKT